ncbi:MAG: hypothetical protein M1298_01040 [Chloroflexi bacterium]|nr:hypothetical protein [Chloroflexota bacterium]
MGRALSQKDPADTVSTIGSAVVTGQVIGDHGKEKEQEIVHAPVRDQTTSPPVHPPSGLGGRVARRLRRGDGDGRQQCQHGRKEFGLDGHC